MRLWLSDSFKLESPMSMDEFIDILEMQVEPHRWLRVRRGYGAFQGAFSTNRFKIRRISDYWYLYRPLPIIWGKAVPGPSGTTISIKIAPHPLVSVFMSLWFVGIILNVLSGIHNGEIQSNRVLLWDMGVLAFAWALWSGWFWYEVQKTKPILLEMFRGTERRI